MFGLPDSYTYLLLNLISIAYPIAQSFEHRITMWKKWKFIFPAILITGIVFIVWDEIFTQIGVWSFNEKFLTGIFIGSLPLEEWLFFFTVPYACIFIYLVLNYFIKKDLLGKAAKFISIFLGITLITIGVISLPKLYTSIAFIGAGSLVLFVQFVVKALWMGRFYLAYLVCLLPFVLINGQLTLKPVVMYDNSQNLGIRLHIPNIANIPIEDMIYNLFMLLMVIGLYEFLKGKEDKKVLKEN